MNKTTSVLRTLLLSASSVLLFNPLHAHTNVEPHNHLKTKSAEATYEMVVDDDAHETVTVAYVLQHRLEVPGQDDVYRYLVKVDLTKFSVAKRQALSLANLGIQSPTHTVELIDGPAIAGWPVDYQLATTDASGHTVWKTLPAILKDTGSTSYKVDAFDPVVADSVEMINPQSDTFAIYVEFSTRTFFADVGLDAALIQTAPPATDTFVPEMKTGHHNVPPPIPPGGSGGDNP
ncbi:hypothetical protein [Actomonas aquatica]|uniref:DUF4424 domain-containing protein n=1 Tax=Actomonas aquatica TaxID=2866162 RepID=A0ABZ1C4C5_9BACT|nr:hypothetical protein [Opitutus sp. WL0086]WRQ86163.1 hypothetical protein K1X11_015215 [Opitutus sp. WL0086]